MDSKSTNIYHENRTAPAQTLAGPFMLLLKFSLLSLLSLGLAQCAQLKSRSEIQREQRQSQLEEDPLENHSPNKKTPPLNSSSPKDLLEENSLKSKYDKEIYATPNLLGTRPKVGIILGPGGVKTFAHTGVLKQLLKARVPIDMIVGVEWGALVAGLYAQAGKIHDVEWKLYKLNMDSLLGGGFFSKKYKANSIKAMFPFFKKNLSPEGLGKLSIPFACPSVSLWSGTVVWQKKGSFHKAIERCLPAPPLFKAKGPWMASLFSIEDSFQLLKKSGMNIIIYVNVLGKGDLLSKEDLISEYESALLWHEVKKINLQLERNYKNVIHVNTRNFMIYDFKNRKSLVSAGERAGKKAAARLSRKYGF